MNIRPDLEDLGFTKADQDPRLTVGLAYLSNNIYIDRKYTSRWRLNINKLSHILGTTMHKILHVIV